MLLSRPLLPQAASDQIPSAQGVSSSHGLLLLLVLGGVIHALGHRWVRAMGVTGGGRGGGAEERVEG
jgi:hypothetical protein